MAIGDLRIFDFFHKSVGLPPSCGRTPSYCCFYIAYTTRTFHMVFVINSTYLIKNLKWKFLLREEVTKDGADFALDGRICRRVLREKLLRRQCYTYFLDVLRTFKTITYFYLMGGKIYRIYFPILTLFLYIYISIIYIHLFNQKCIDARMYS